MRPDATKTTVRFRHLATRGGRLLAIAALIAACAPAPAQPAALAPVRAAVPNAPASSAVEQPSVTEGATSGRIAVGTATPTASAASKPTPGPTVAPAARRAPAPTLAPRAKPALAIVTATAGPRPATTTATSTTTSTTTATTTAATTTTTVYPHYFGVSSFPQYFGSADNKIDFDRLAAAGMKLVRFDARWADMEPTTKGVYSSAFFSRLDSIMSLADARGIKLILVFHKTPKWARGYTGTEGTPPTRRQDYADAIKVLAAHYKGRSGMMYEIWNEPNYKAFWNTSTGPSAAAYTDMLKRAYTAVKSVAPGASVIGGSLNHFDKTYLAAMYAAGAHGYFDGFSIHPYTDGRPITSTSSAMYDFRPAITGLRDYLSTHGDMGKPIWITEFGYTLSGSYAVTESTRASYLAAAVAYVKAWPYVRGMAAFTLNTLNSTGYGLVNHSTGALSATWKAYVTAVKG